MISSSHNLPLQKFSQYDHIAVWNSSSYRKLKKKFLVRGNQKEGWLIEIGVIVILCKCICILEPKNSP